MARLCPPVLEALPRCHPATARVENGARRADAVGVAPLPYSARAQRLAGPRGRCAADRGRRFRASGLGQRVRAQRYASDRGHPDPTQFGLGAIGSVGDVDVWKRTGVSLFDLIFAYVDTTGSTDRDSFLDVLLNDGTTVLESDNNSGPSTSSASRGPSPLRPARSFSRSRRTATTARSIPMRSIKRSCRPPTWVSRSKGTTPRARPDWLRRAS